MSRWLTLLAGCCLVGITSVISAEVLPLELAAEYPVIGMQKNHLSGLARCQGRWWTVSDRDDNAIYELVLQHDQQVFTTQPYAIDVPEITVQPLGNAITHAVVSRLKQSKYDFEGISCDQQQNLYVVSEAYSSVLQVNRDGGASWLKLPRNLRSVARASGLLQRQNAGLEGIALSDDGSQLWLAAERESRGLIRLTQHQLQWRCIDNCIVLNERHLVDLPSPHSGKIAADFSGLSLYQNKLFTLERAERLICRRNLDNAAVERCWSFADTESLPEKSYSGAKLGMAEALVIEADAAWVGLDTAGKIRKDQMQHPIIWQFKAPATGWLY